MGQTVRSAVNRLALRVVNRLRSSEPGFTLIETSIALGVLAIVAAGVLPMGLMATKTTENQGHLSARTTEYAQDKLEQLMALAYGDVLTDTRSFPAAAAGGSGLALGGTLNTVAPIAQYSDYLDLNGNVLPPAANPPADWYYLRVWQIVSPRANLKQITVVAQVRRTVLGGPGLVPRSTISSLKTFPF